MSIMMRAGVAPDELRSKVEALSGQRLSDCYQCGTCAASCPLVAEMDVPPDLLLRQVAFGVQGVLERQAFWVCVGCDSCAERCPRGIDMARIMEALRQVCLREGGEQLDLTRLSPLARRELPPIALVASLRRNT